MREQVRAGQIPWPKARALGPNSKNLNFLFLFSVFAAAEAAGSALEVPADERLECAGGGLWQQRPPAARVRQQHVEVQIH